VCTIRKNGVAIVGNEIIGPTTFLFGFPSSFRPEEGFSLRVSGRTLRVPFILYTGILPAGKAYDVRCCWAPGPRLFALPKSLAEHRRAFLDVYRREHGRIGENEDVTRLESIAFRKRPPHLLLECRRLKRWDVVATNFILDRPCPWWAGHDRTIRRSLSINDEVKNPAGLETSQLGNTLGVTLVVGNPKRSELIVSLRSRAVRYPLPLRLKVAAGGEVRPNEWHRAGPDVCATALRMAREETGLLRSEIQSLRCIGIGRSVLNAVPEILFEATTNVPLESVVDRRLGRDQWENEHVYVVSCSLQRPEILSWIFRGEWAPQHLVGCLLYLRRHHPRCLRVP
jgi:hypothetical protein